MKDGVNNWKIKVPPYTEPEEGKSAPSIIILIEVMNQFFDFRKNIITEKIEYRESNTEKWHLINDGFINSILVSFKSRDVAISKALIEALFMSNFIQKFNPIEDYFNRLGLWDGKDYIKKLAQTVKTTDDETWHFYLEKWLVAMVKSGFFQNTVNQQMLVFYGKQGVGKTRWFLRLLPPALNDLFFTGYTKLEDQMFQAKLARYLLLFLDEMDTYSGRLQALIKSLITQPVIKIRPLYSCFDREYPRIASLAAAINHENFLNDLSGSRRYLVVEVKEIDHNHNVSMDKVLAQAFALAKSSEYKDYFTSEEIHALEERNEQFKIKSDVEVLISQYYEVCLETDIAARYMTATQIMNELKNKSELRPKYSVHFVGSVMRKLGFIKSHVGTGKDKRSVYIVKEKE